MQKYNFLKFKMAAISQNVEQLGPYFAPQSGTTQDICVQNIIGISLKIEGARSSTKIRKHILDPPTVAAAASNLSNTYRSHSSCGT